MSATPLRADICIIGAGSGGLSVAAGAARLGALTVLIERAAMGGDCLNAGCVPSKSLLAAADAAARARQAPTFGIDLGPPRVDGGRVHDHVHDIIAGIAPHDSVERFESLGVTVLRASARFVGLREVVAGERRVVARRFVVATGSAPAVPPLAGLGTVPYLTNETLFDLRVIPKHLIVIGGGPIGVEMAQAHRRLGALVTVLTDRAILPRDDPELVAVVRERLRADGVALHENVRVSAVAADAAGGVVVAAIDRGVERRVRGSHVLIATGRRANTDGLELERAGIAYTAHGITVDRRLRTTNRRVYAIGDVIGGWQFTHLAAHHATVVLKNALFRIPARVAPLAEVPRVTYGEPELAQVGLTEADARAGGATVTIARAAFADNDRARTERCGDGLAKIVLGRRGRILGAGIVGRHAGELIQPWVLAIAEGLRISRMASVIAPYPTLGEIGRRAAGAYFEPVAFGALARRVVRVLASFG